MTMGVNQAFSVPMPNSAKTDKSGAKTQGDDADFSAALDQADPKADNEGNEGAVGTEHQPGRWSRHGGFGVKTAGRGQDGARGKEGAEATEESDASDVSAQAKTAGTPLSALMVARELDMRTERAGTGGRAEGTGSRPTMRGDTAGSEPDIKIDLDPASVAAAERAARSEAGRPASANSKSAAASTGNVLAANARTDGSTATGNEARTGAGRMSSAAALNLSLTPTASEGETIAAPTDATLSPDRDFLRTLGANSNSGRSQVDGFGRRTDAKSERVTVVAQQNIPAPVAQPSASTSTALANLISADPSWRSAAAQPFQQVGAQPGLTSAHTLKLQLHPAELGMVTANLRFSGDQLTVELRVENAEAYRRLTADSETIVKSLRSMGLSIDQVTIQQPQSSSSAQGGADGNNASAGFGPRDQQSFSSAGSGGNGNDTGGQQFARNENDGAYGSEGAAPASANRADGGVYI
ncbi:chemotaxis protein MotD [Mesorhizobium soli]|jgi:chemotaxis protein MotD|uniref:flagellar hook-length control protein FliK n=1 Tax=Pseudaminobacter soli (ex Li et al. 2025) TaxID=1295366 RepID=UPI00247717BA|nr:flagellar hook-length control protein FliK [Mesorhizobium soli]MDH6233386.1 chemotaxis protein MotD [Mesorhizobium soli]